MTSILALDTSTDACSVALAHEGEVLHRHHLEARAHHRLLLPMIEDVLACAGCAPADLDAVAFGCGPGSFTGLRIATAVTQAIAWAHDLRIIGVSTLELLAAAAAKEAPAAEGVITLLDARMGECYWNLFLLDGNAVHPILDDGLATPAVIAGELARRCAAHPGRWLLLGSQWLPESDWSQVAGVDVQPASEVCVDARVLLELAQARLLAGEGLPAREAIPRYLRDERRWRRLGDPVPG